MAIETLKFINIMGPIDALDSALCRCFEQGSFHAETASELMQGAKGFYPVADLNPYTEPLSKLGDFFSRAGLEAPPPSAAPLSLPDSEGYLQRTVDALTELINRRDSLSVTITNDEQILKQVSPLIDLDIPLQNIFSLEYIRFRFGRMTRENYDKFTATYTGDEMYVFLASSVEDEYVWGIYFAPRSHIDTADATFASLHFERIHISDRASGTPAEVYDIISAELQSLRSACSDLEEQIRRNIAEHTDDWKAIYSHMLYQNALFECRKCAMRTKSNFYLGGWIPASEADAFCQSIETLPGVSCVVEDPDGGKTLPEAPTRLRNCRLFRPFELFVRMYGLPRYGEIDPTPLVAVTYCILFGLMFGDVGQGLVLFAAGLILAKWKKSDFGRIIATVGVFATLGGFLYGSVFGYENLLPGFRPLEDAHAFNIALFASVGMGVFLIVVCIVINIINGLRRGNLQEALFGNNGVMGLVFYLAVLCGVVLMFGFGRSVFTVPYIIVFVGIPLLAMFLKEPLAKLVQRRKDVLPKNKGEFILENFFELFDVLLSYITNTISFVRIGAFALNHAGMMMFVFILARMSGGSENLLVVILGNALVIGLEGLIVGIQVLRLEFYELFSRFFTGEGRAFTPVGAADSKN